MKARAASVPEEALSAAQRPILQTPGSAVTAAPRRHLARWPVHCQMRTKWLASFFSHVDEDADAAAGVFTGDEAGFSQSLFGRLNPFATLSGLSPADMRARINEGNAGALPSI